MPMLIIDKFVNVLNPKLIEGVLIYRAYSDQDGWGEDRKYHFVPFDSVEEARAWVNLHRIGDEE